MKYTLFIFLFFSINAHAQSAIGIYRVIEKTTMGYDEQADLYDFDTVPVPMRSLNAKVMFTADQMLIIDDDTTFINLGAGTKKKQDTAFVTLGWNDAEYNGDACRVYMYVYPGHEYQKVVIIYDEDRMGYLYILSSLKQDVIPTASNFSMGVKKKSK